MGIRQLNYPRVEVSTILTPDERLRVDAAGEGLYRAWHRKKPSEVLTDLQGQSAMAVLISVEYCRTTDWNSLRRMIRELPRVPTIALLTREERGTAETLLRLGQTGVHEVIDVRTPAGWSQLRNILSERCTDSVERQLLERLQVVAGSMTRECWTFFETVVRTSKGISSVRELAVVLNVLPSTLMSRFFRAGLPAPKRYLAMARLARAAYLFENSGFSIANVANHLEYSSPQSFGRHIRATMGMTALEFRRRYQGDTIVQLYEQRLIMPYRSILERFDPLSFGAYPLSPPGIRISPQ